MRGVTYATFDDLLHYCRCVAGSIGRLSLGVFGSRDPAGAAPLADALGVGPAAHQHPARHPRGLANGRVYLPAEDLERFGCALRRRPGRPIPGWPSSPRWCGSRRSGRCGWYATGPAAAAPARPAQRRVRRGDGRDLPPAARADRGEPGCRAQRPGRRCPARRRPWSPRRALAATVVPGRPRPRGPAVLAGPAAAGAGPVTGRAHVAVIGGGLAGITAAIALAEQGTGVTLLEARPRLGGATSSFTRGDLVIDNGQHVFLRCCTSLPRAAGPARHDRLGSRPGPVRRHRAVPGRPRHAPPHRPARPAAPGRGARRLRHLSLPNGFAWAAPPSPCAASTRPGRVSTASGSATGSPPGARTSGRGGCCGTCSSCPR